MPAFVYAPTLLGVGRDRTFLGLAHHVDWFATFLGAAGVAAEEDPDSDSIDLWPALLDAAGAGGGGGEIAERTEIAFTVTATSAVLRIGSLKLIHGYTNATWYDGLEGANLSSCFPGDSSDFLFDLAVDPEERTNLFRDPSRRATADAMIARGRELWETQGFDTGRARTTVYAHNDAIHAAWHASSDRRDARVVTPWGCDVEYADGSAGPGGKGG